MKLFCQQCKDIVQNNWFGFTTSATVYNILTGSACNLCHNQSIFYFTLAPINECDEIKFNKMFTERILHAPKYLDNANMPKMQ